MKLTDLIAELRKSYGDVPEPPTRDPFDLVLWVNVALKHHGRVLCRNKTPACGECPVRASCAYAQQ